MVSDVLLPLAVIAWLLALTFFDLRTRAVPHIVWVGLPAVGATCLALWRGDYWLVLAAGAAMLASERHQLPAALREAVHNLATLVVILCIPLADDGTRTGAIAVFAFWSCYELAWWGGADALTGITLMVWQPTSSWLGWLCLSLVVVYLLARWRGQREHIPALPAFALGTGLALTVGNLWLLPRL